MLRDKCMSLTKKSGAFGSGAIPGVLGKKKLYHVPRKGSRRKVKETCSTLLSQDRSSVAK